MKRRFRRPCPSQALAKLSEYAVETEDGDTKYDISDTVDGQSVIGHEDEHFVGGELVLHDDGGEIRLQARDYDAAKHRLA